jgi:transposase
MTLRSQSLLPVPKATVAAMLASFSKGNLYVDLRAEFGTLYDDQLLADLYPPFGCPLEVSPWRMALVMAMPYIEGLTDCQAADHHDAGHHAGLRHGAIDRARFSRM